MTKLTAISPIDGRYRDKCEVLADYFSSVTPAVREQPAAAAQPFKNLDII